MYKSNFTTKTPLVVLVESYIHILLIILAVLLLFGGKKIPELMKGIGQGIREFKDAMNGKNENQSDKKEEKKIEDKKE